MPYFFVIPIYFLGFVGILIAALVCRLRPNLRHFSGYLLAGAIGSLPGFIVGNLLLAAIVAPIVMGKVVFPDSLYWLSALIVGFGVFIGPFVVSFSGSLTGAWIGWRLYGKRQRRVVEHLSAQD